MPAPTRSSVPDSAARAQQAWLDGQKFARRRRWHDAAQAYSRASRLQPKDALYWMNLADAELRGGQPARALDAAAIARQLDASSPLSLALQVNALQALHRHDALCDLLEGVDPAMLDAALRGVLADAQVHAGRATSAIGNYLQALAADPADAARHLRLGHAFNALGMKREAAECLRTALLLGAGERQVAIHDLLAFYEREVCDWRGGDTQVQALRAAIDALPADAAVETNPFAHVTLLDDPMAQRRAAEACARHIAQHVTPLPPRRARAADRLRIGYVSADFQRHATTYLMAELLERHDRKRFETVLYSLGRDDGSDVRQRLARAGDRFVDAQALTTEALSRRVRDDAIDILVDLKGYTLGARPALFAYRAAPLQVAYLGYPGTSGAPAIDYIVGDRHVTPLEHAAHFSEQIAQLPGCYQCNDGTRPLPVAPPRADHGLPDGALVLCGFNQPYKISPGVFDVWCGLLRRLPDAVLWLLEWTPQAPSALRREAAARGVDPARIVFAPNVDQAAHLDRIACADLFLDTWPCNGHTTASDVLWAGVPVVTLRGQTFASRVAASLLHEVGAPELVCDEVAGYEALALRLAGDADKRHALRLRLEAARRTSALFDGANLARDLEALYERMWARAVAGLAPAHLAAAATTG